MLESINLDNLSYSDLLEEAISQIPLYGSEWTNFNVSDPGITILENLTSFNYLQQTAINTVSDEVRLRLLKLLGFKGAQSRSALVLSEVSSAFPLKLYPHQKFITGDLTFEPLSESTHHPWRTAAVLTQDGDSYKDITYLLDRDVKKSVPLFGLPAKEGNALCCILTDKPDFSEEVLLYAEIEPSFLRTPPGSDSPHFAEITWQVYTESGWQSLPFKDSTYEFLVSGEISLGPSSLTPAVFEAAGFSGYAIRCLLLSQRYDLSPRLSSLGINLVRLTQKDTLSRMLRLRGRKTIRIHEIHVYPYSYVYARESHDSPYRRYEPYSPGMPSEGRYYDKTIVDEKTAEFSFSRARFGYQPGHGEDDLIIVCCTEDMARSMSLGAVYGYADQELEIDSAKNLLRDSFYLMVEATMPGDFKEYSFVAPGDVSPYGFCYELLSAEGKIRVIDPGMGRDIHAYTAACAVTHGAQGNIRAGNRLILMGSLPGTGSSLTNVSHGFGGITEESVDDISRRFLSKMQHPEAAVLPLDYERIALTTPGLCLHKAKAYYDKPSGAVHVVVKPHSDGALPTLSPDYLRIIEKRLSEYRTLTTRFKLLQPQYLPIDVSGTIYVRSHFLDAKEEITTALKACLDFTASDAPFGAPVLFNEVFQTISNLPCVLSVYSLSLTPRRRQEGTIQGLDFYPAPFVLCYPGSISLEINTRGDS